MLLKYLKNEFGEYCIDLDDTTPNKLFTRINSMGEITHGGFIYKEDYEGENSFYLENSTPNKKLVKYSEKYFKTN